MCACVYSHVYMLPYITRDTIEGEMAFNVGFYGSTSISDRLNRDSVPDASTNRSSLRISDHNAQQLEWENRRAVLLEHVRNQDLVSKLTEEIKKTVNESMEGVINGLRSEVTELRSELASIKKDGESSGSWGAKQGKLPKALLVSVLYLKHELL